MTYVLFPGISYLCLLDGAWQMYLGPQGFIVILHFLNEAKFQFPRVMHSLNSHLFIMEQLKVEYLLIANGRKINVFHHSKEHKVASHIIPIIKSKENRSTSPTVFDTHFLYSNNNVIHIQDGFFSSVRAIKSFSKRYNQ